MSLPVRTTTIHTLAFFLAVSWLAALDARAQSAIELEFLPATAAHDPAVRAYQSIWDEYGRRIVASLEARSCLPFAEPIVSAVVADGVSHSGGPEHPMQLRATYAEDVKRATLVHELGHRHLWQLEERIGDVDGHMTLYLILDRVWADVWGQQFADERIDGESGWRSDYDYAEAWRWARSLADEDRARIWAELLGLNGFQDGCTGEPEQSG
jgi:hypothetical protein